jgi:hypothetical protein
LCLRCREYAAGCRLLLAARRGDRKSDEDSRSGKNKSPGTVHM